MREAATLRVSAHVSIAGEPCVANAQMPGAHVAIEPLENFVVGSRAGCNSPGGNYSHRCC